MYAYYAAFTNFHLINLVLNYLDHLTWFCLAVVGQMGFLGLR